MKDEVWLGDWLDGKDLWGEVWTEKSNDER